MKRKLALFMAVMMTLSLLPMNVFAATTGTLVKSVGAVPEDTVMFETGVYAGGLKQASNNDDVEYYVGGSDLVLKVTDQVAPGEQFRIEISNADFFFRGEDYSVADSGTSKAALQTILSSTMVGETLPTTLGGNSESWGSSTTTKYARQDPGDTYQGAYTYDVNKGLWSQNANSGSGAYYRFPGVETSTGRNGIPYKLALDPYSDKKAVITILPDNAAHKTKADTYKASEKITSTDLSTLVAGTDYNGDFLSGTEIWDGWEIKIPLVTLTDDGTDTKIRVESSTAGITSGTWLFGVTSGNATKTEVTDPQSARDDFDVLDDLVISETRLGSIRSGQVYIKLPSGFEWADIYNTDIKVGLSPGLSWGNEDDRLKIGYSSTSTGTTGGYAPTGTGTKSSYNGTAIGYGSSYYTTGTSGDYWNVYSPAGTVGTGERYGIASGTNSTTTWREYIGRNTVASYGSIWVNVDDYTVWKTNVANNVITPGTVAGTSYEEYIIDSTGLGLGGNIADWIASGETKSNSSSTSGAWDYALNYKNPGTTSEDRSILVLSLNGIGRSENVLGSVYINGLSFYAEDNAPYGPVNAEISNVDSNIEVVTDQTFLAGTRVDWTISLKALGTIPELVNGRYDAEEPWSASDVHKTAKVQFKENTTAAWWAQRQTVFSLPEGVKFRKVQITKVEKMEELSTNYKTQLKDTGYTSSYYGYAPGSGVYLNDGEKHGYVTVDGNQVTFNNLKVDVDEKATIEFDCWVSIESGFQGDVTLSVSGSAIPEQPGTVPAVVIAKQISPVSISTKITDVKIGYQYVATASIEITETKAGILEKGKDVRVSVTDLVSTDLYFSSDTKVAVKNAGETGALKIKDVQNVAAGSSTVYGLAVNGGTIKFVVDAASAKASTIVISDVAVKVDRTVPETNKYPYKVVVWGKAIANNYQYINDSEHYRYPRTSSNTVNGTNYAKDLFGTAGIQADYIRIVTSANDKPNVLYAEVRVTIGEKYYTVNGKQSDMDAAAYISTASNSTMVPLRFVSNALGITSEGVIWDDTNRTVTIIAPDGKIAQFKIGDSTMTINGTPITMMSPDGLPVMAEIVGDRSYVPFRALGDAFGIPVEWEEDTQSAVYNKGAATGTTEATATEAATTESTR